MSAPRSATVDNHARRKPRLKTACRS